MAIKITEEPDVHVTGDELTRYRYDYNKGFSMYCGPVPTFEQYVRSRKAREEEENAHSRERHR